MDSKSKTHGRVSSADAANAFVKLLGLSPEEFSANETWESVALGEEIEPEGSISAMDKQTDVTTIRI